MSPKTIKGGAKLCFGSPQDVSKKKFHIFSKVILGTSKKIVG